MVVRDTESMTMDRTCKQMKHLWIYVNYLKSDQFDRCYYFLYAFEIWYVKNITRHTK